MKVATEIEREGGADLLRVEMGVVGTVGLLEEEL